MATIYLAFSLYLKLVTWHLHGVRYYKKFRDDFKYMRRDSPGCPVVNTSSSSAGGRGSIPGWEAKFPHASQPKTKNKKHILKHTGCGKPFTEKSENSTCCEC